METIIFALWALIGTTKFLIEDDDTFGIILNVQTWATDTSTRK